MKLEYLMLSGFRGFRKPIDIRFAPSFTVIDGRNGTGKSSLCDALEFALTGTITKYQDAKAAGESISDYYWWMGDQKAHEHYVEVGFSSADGERIKIRREQFTDPDPRALAKVEEHLCNRPKASGDNMRQLCRVSIIRDELIAALSLDLSETERFALLRDAIGVPSADAEIARGQRLFSLSAKRVAEIQSGVDALNRDLAAAGRRLDEARGAVAEDRAIQNAARQLRGLVGQDLVPDALIEPARFKLVQLEEELAGLQKVIDTGDAVQETRRQLAGLEIARQAFAEEIRSSEIKLAALRNDVSDVQRAKIESEARELAELATNGRKLGLHDGQCPLCGAEHTPESFLKGVVATEARARKLDAEALEGVSKMDNLRAAEASLINATQRLNSLDGQRSQLIRAVAEHQQLRVQLAIPEDDESETLVKKEQVLLASLTKARSSLRALETIKLNPVLARAIESESNLRKRLDTAEIRLGRARRAESTAKALYDATRRAVGEIMDRRLERVLPLMSELYQRLRPHPVWRELEYSIRGDVKRFLRLQVGDQLNPQFLFSSGQRRATGLAFLLSINMAMAWNRWSSIVLDDPVQHVDDFRTIQLAEVLAQLCSSGRQVVCAVEDAALADLLCRRLPVERLGDGRRVSLGSGADGALAMVKDQELSPLPHRVLPETPRSDEAALLI